MSTLITFLKAEQTVNLDRQHKKQNKTEIDALYSNASGTILCIIHILGITIYRKLMQNQLP